MKRRDFLRQTALAGTLACTKPFPTPAAATAQTFGKTFDVAVIGAGVFGAWTAYFLNRAGQKVLLLDAYGPSNDRASSGGESRVIRLGYGANEIYTRWVQRALPLWNELFARQKTRLFHRTGVLWICAPADLYALQTISTLEKLHAKFEKLSHADLAIRFPQIHVEEDKFGIFEPESGALLARRAVQATVEDAVQNGVEYRRAAVAPPTGSGLLHSLQLSDGTTINAGTYVFCCGPWLPKLFPQLLANRIVPTRQEVFFFGIPAGDVRFTPPNFPAWIVLSDEYYGIPDIESRGFKIAYDAHGPIVDPDTLERTPTAEGLAAARAYIARRFPALQGAPLVESRVCQYENTSNGDFLVDRHPDFANAWLVGGGSGHGFKHGPALGEYTTNQILAKSPAEPRFSLATKKSVQDRAVF